MKVLNKNDKKIYNAFINTIKFEKIDCWDVEIPKGWLNNIKSIKDNTQWR